MKHEFDIFEEKAQPSDTDAYSDSDVESDTIIERNILPGYCGYGCLPANHSLNLGLCVCTYESLSACDGVDAFLDEVPLLRNIFALQTDNEICIEFRVGHPVRPYVTMMTAIMIEMVQSMDVAHLTYVNQWNNGYSRRNVRAVVFIAMFNYLIANPIILRTHTGFRVCLHCYGHRKSACDVAQIAQHAIIIFLHRPAQKKL
jgi:hypothetical protein